MAEKCCPNDGSGVSYLGWDDGFGAFGDEVREFWRCEDCGEKWQAEDLVECMDLDVDQPDFDSRGAGRMG